MEVGADKWGRPQARIGTAENWLAPVGKGCTGLVMKRIHWLVVLPWPSSEAHFAASSAVVLNLQQPRKDLRRSLASFPVWMGFS